MRTLAIDIETYSSVSLLKSGVYAYAESPDFEILLFAYAFDDEPVSVVDIAQGESLPDNVLSALFDKGVLKTAFNANFERTCLSRWLAASMPPAEWSCTAVMAKELGLPNSLDAVGAVIGLPEDRQKLKTGKALIRYFSIPCKPTKVNGGRIRNMPEHAPEKWAQYKEYNRQDVEAERAIRKKLSRFSIAESEQRLWEHDQHINDRGVMVDLAFAEKAIEYDTQLKDELFTEARALTGLDNPKSTAQVKSWIADTAGVEIESLRKDKIADIKSQISAPDVHKMLELRAGLSKTSTEKYAAMVRTACRDNRIRGLTQFYGAGRTGRWAGRLVQMQNLPQNKISDQDLGLARELVKGGHFTSMSRLFDAPTMILSQLIRTAFIPKPGCRFIVADFSAIEARVLAWFADETWRMDVFNTHGKIYEASAEKMFHLPPGSVKKGDPMRTKGKIAELALGYGGSVGAMKNMGALNMGLTEKELKPIVTSWRAANKNITNFWWAVDSAVKNILTGRIPKKLPHGIELRKDGPLLRLRLPSGRELSYVKPRLSEGTGPYGDDQITYEGILQSTGTWGRIETYGPKLVENIVQATARDCLAEAIGRLEAKGYPVVFHVHDEVICEIPIGTSSTNEINEIMGAPISWAPGLPLKADAYECEYYKKD